MNAQERQVIEALFARIQHGAAQAGPRDAGAEALIEEGGDVHRPRHFRKWLGGFGGYDGDEAAFEHGYDAGPQNDQQGWGTS